MVRLIVNGCRLIGLVFIVVNVCSIVVCNMCIWCLKLWLSCWLCFMYGLLCSVNWFGYLWWVLMLNVVVSVCLLCVVWVVMWCVVLMLWVMWVLILCMLVCVGCLWLVCWIICLIICVVGLCMCSRLSCSC